MILILLNKLLSSVTIMKSYSYSVILDLVPDPHFFNACHIIRGIGNKFRMTKYPGMTS